MNKTALSLREKGFTLVELLVVIAIIAVLALVVILVINPVEITAQSRDSRRVADLANLQNAINVTVQQDANKSTNIYCGGTPTTPGNCSTNGTGNSTTGTTAVDGTGWAKINIASQNTVAVSALPIDPTNSTADHYTYCGNATGYEIKTVLESNKYKGQMATDGGDDPNTYQVGTQLSMTCTY